MSVPLGTISRKCDTADELLTNLSVHLIPDVSVGLLRDWILIQLSESGLDIFLVVRASGLTFPSSTRLLWKVVDPHNVPRVSGLPPSSARWEDTCVDSRMAM